MILQMDGRFPSPHRIERVIDILDDDGVIAIPTDTTYALACWPDHKAAVNQLTALRRLDPKKPLSLVFRDLKQIDEYAFIDDQAFRIMRRYLPGPYTFILHANRSLPRRVVGNKRKALGARVPAHGVPQAIVETAGKPLIVTSAIDPDTGETLYDPWTVDNVFGHGLAAVLDGGEIPGEFSSVIDLTTEVPEVIRAGLGDVSDFG